MNTRFAPSTFKWGNGSSWSYGDLLRSRPGLGRRPSIITIIFRLCFVATLLFGIVLFPWWLVMALAFIFLMLFSFPLEAILSVLFLDVLSGGIYFASGIVLALPVLLWIKRRLRF